MKIKEQIVVDLTNASIRTLIDERDAARAELESMVTAYGAAREREERLREALRDVRSRANDALAVEEPAAEPYEPRRSRR